MRYVLYDEGAEREIEATSLDDAKLAAEAMIREWADPQDATYWAECWVYAGTLAQLVAARDEYAPPDDEVVRIQVDPEEPPCADGSEHDWQTPIELVGGIAENPGVWGHGGGIVTSEACVRCGCGRHTDTWATCPLDGSQGHTTVRYEAGAYTYAPEGR